MTTSLRPAQTEDLDQLDPLVAAYHRFEDIQLAADERRGVLTKLLASGDAGQIFFIEHAGKAVGYAALTFGFSIELGGRDAFIDELFIEPDFRAQGIGTEAMTLLLQQAKSRDVKAVHLEVGRSNDAAQAYYRKLGFSPRERFHLMTWKA